MSKASHEILIIVSDSKINVDSFNQGRNKRLVFVNSGFSSKYLSTFIGAQSSN